VLDPARFALHLGTHLLARYAHVSATFVTVEQLRWARINDSSSSANSSEAGHPHAFWRDGAEKRFVEVEVARQGEEGGGAVARVAGGLRDLLGAMRWLSPTRFSSHLIVCNSAQVDGLGVREFRAGRVYDVDGGGRPDLQHVGGSAVYVRTSEHRVAERREATGIWGGKLNRWGTSVGGR
jgi:hypothetical protein